VPDASDTSPWHHGRLYAAHQHAQAQALLCAAQAGDPEALARFGFSSSTPHRQLTLQDAEAVVAREAGFTDWAQLMRHIEALDAAAHNAAARGDRDRTTVHIRCGSDIRDTLQAAGFSGAFLEFADPFCMGPVPALPLPQHLRRRAQFIASAFDVNQDAALSRLEREYTALESTRDHDRIVLWFEHDSYDQLILAFVLKRLGDLRPRGRVELIAVNRIPGVQRFIGLGQLAPDVLAWLWEYRTAIGDAQFELGTQVWDAFRADTPTALHTIACTGTPALPLMAPALLRHLRELPDLHTGLSLTEQLILEIVRDLGPLPLGRIFAELMRLREPLPYLGDTMFRWMARGLVNQKVPLLSITPNHDDAPWPEYRVALTQAGEQVLDRTINRLDLQPTVRWVGGIAIPGDRGAWCWSEAHAKPVWRAFEDE
jgi:hypothetical protein